MLIFTFASQRSASSAPIDQPQILPGYRHYRHMWVVLTMWHMEQTKNWMVINSHWECIAAIWIIDWVETFFILSRCVLRSHYHKSIAFNYARKCASSGNQRLTCLIRLPKLLVCGAKNNWYRNKRYLNIE